ncbi:hypothetical protein INS49_004254 [Diaporthe citri]|uniref:uncharacterized protein n=1 Tax=Diaporthe citri TaxID=83186 RepID=UPI001C7F65C2|nr:uncharacterized protein INS49_004254 [Diaporthe citri]KAG6355173.1 hypothetical protein INS49_004254 [Diaporthe citri]
MSTAHETPDIRDRCRDIKDRLRDLERQLPNEEGSWGNSTIHDLLDRFTLWTGDLGAMRSPRSQFSLEMRLSESPELRLLIQEQLGDFRAAVLDLSEAFLEFGDEGSAEGESIAEDGLDSLKLDDIKLSLATVLQCLRGLFDIGIAVRKLTTRDRFQRALLRSRDTVYAGADRDHVEQKYPKLNTESASWLASRLVTANVKRRKVMIYNGYHKSMLGAEDDVYEDEPDSTALSSKASTFAPPKPLADISALAAEEDCDTISLGTASTSFSSNDSLRMPTLAALSPDKEPFECPVCCMVQRFEREKAWKYGFMVFLIPRVVHESLEMDKYRSGKIADVGTGSTCTEI